MVTSVDIITKNFLHKHVVMMVNTSLGQSEYVMQNYSINEMTERGHNGKVSPWQGGIFIGPQQGFGQARNSKAMMSDGLWCVG